MWNLQHRQKWIFFQALPDKTLRENGTECKGGKRSKEQIMVMFCINMDGEFEKTLVIKKCGRPWCFKSIGTRALPITQEHNKKAWMTYEFYQRA